MPCFVCYNIPRDVPIPCCEAGHIVCQDCRRRFMVCPTCRGRLESNTNSLAARQVMLVRHKCKFSFYGCDVKMKLKEIVNHEKHCPERTITCPHRKCREEFQLKKFNEHSMQTGCAKTGLIIIVVMVRSCLTMNQVPMVRSLDIALMHRQDFHALTIIGHSVNLKHISFHSTWL